MQRDACAGQEPIQVLYFIFRFLVSTFILLYVLRFGTCHSTVQRDCRGEVRLQRICAQRLVCCRDLRQLVHFPIHFLVHFVSILIIFCA